MKTLAFGLLVLGFAAAWAAQAQVSPPSPAATNDLVPLPLKLPIPGLGRGPQLLPKGNFEKPRDKPRPPFLVPRGVTNLALHKPVSASTNDTKAGRLIQGPLTLICDGIKEPEATNWVQMPRSHHWVQIDLGESCSLYAIVVWHQFDAIRVFHDVIIQIADDPEFSRNVRTLFNNDFDDSAGLGAGPDKEYYETYEGRLIDAKGERARYVRCHLRGQHDIGVPDSEINAWTEVEVWGLPRAGTPVE